MEKVHPFLKDDSRKENSEIILDSETLDGQLDRLNKAIEKMMESMEDKETENGVSVPSPISLDLGSPYLLGSQGPSTLEEFTERTVTVDGDLEINLENLASSVERSYMINEDFRSFELREMKQHEQEFNLSVSELYSVWTDVVRILKRLDYSSFPLKTSLGPFNVKVHNNSLHLPQKENLQLCFSSLDENSYVKHLEKEILELKKKTLEPLGNLEFLKDLQKDMLERFENLESIDFTSEVSPNYRPVKSQVVLEMEIRNLSKIKKTYEKGTSELEWKRSEVDVLRELYQDKIKQLEENIRKIEAKHKLIHNAEIRLVKRQVGFEEELKKHLKEKQKFDRVKEDFKQQIKDLKFNYKEFIKEGNSTNNSSACNTARVESNPEIETFESEIASLEKEKGFATPELRDGIETKICRLKTSMSVIKSNSIIKQTSLSRINRKSSLISSGWVTPSCPKRLETPVKATKAFDFNDSASSVDSSSDKAVNDALKQFNVKVARVTETERKLVTLIQKSESGSEIVEIIKSYSDELYGKEEAINRDLKDISLEKLNITKTKSELEAREKDLTRKSANIENEQKAVEELKEKFSKDITELIKDINLVF